MRILRHAGRHAERLLRYLTNLAMADPNEVVTNSTEDPITLLAKAGYSAMYANTEKKKNSIKKYYASGEMLCTFNDVSRHEHYHIVHAVKHGADLLKRADFNGREERQDDYGTSVISIQMLKTGGFISIKNRYNMAVEGCDNTFGSNPDNIVKGLSASLKRHFNVEFKSSDSVLPSDFVLMNEHIFQFNFEDNNIYYGHHAWAHDGVIHAVDRASGDALFDHYLFDNKTKTLRNVDPRSDDSFPNDFNRFYGGMEKLYVRDGNLCLEDNIVIDAKMSRIFGLNLTRFISMGSGCLSHAWLLQDIQIPNVREIGDGCLRHANVLKKIDAPSLVRTGNDFVNYSSLMKSFYAPNLRFMGNDCMKQLASLETFDAPSLQVMGDRCLQVTSKLDDLDLPSLTHMGKSCITNAPRLMRISAPLLRKISPQCLSYLVSLRTVDLSSVARIGSHCFQHTDKLERLDLPELIEVDRFSFGDMRSLAELQVPKLEKLGMSCFQDCYVLDRIETPSLTSIGDWCFLGNNNAPLLKPAHASGYRGMLHRLIARFG